MPQCNFRVSVASHNAISQCINAENNQASLNISARDILINRLWFRGGAETVASYLIVGARVPSRVDDDDAVGCGESQTQAADLRREQEDGDVAPAPLEATNEILPLGGARAAVDAEEGDAEVSQLRLHAGIACNGTHGSLVKKILTNDDIRFPMIVQHVAMMRVSTSSCERSRH